MPDQPKDWRAERLVSGAELIVGWRQGRSRLDAAPVDLSVSVASEMHDLSDQTLNLLGTMRARPWEGNPALEPGEEYLAVPTSRFARGDSEGGDESEPDDWEDLTDLQRLVAQVGSDSITREDLRAGRYLFYAVICSTVEGSRLGFVRQIDPHRVSRTGAITAVLGGQGLQQLTDPVFVFESGFDLVVAPEEIAVLRLEAFNRLFADFDTLAAAAGPNAGLIAAKVGKVSAPAMEALVAAAQSSRSIARQLSRLASKADGLPTISANKLRAALKKHDLPAGLLTRGSDIHFEPDSARLFLDMVEQVFYETDFTGEHRRADRYSAL